MLKNKKILGLIIAKGKSNGLPGKNIKPLLGVPLIAWTIKSAKKSKYLDSLVLSTDNNRIATIAKKYGVGVPFMRPKALAMDTSKSIDVILHALNWLSRHRQEYDLVMLLQPTSPLRSAEDIDKAIELLFARKGSAVVSVCECEHSPFWMNVLPVSGNMKAFIKTNTLNKNRQELPTFYRLNGAIYVAYCDYLRRNNGFFGERTYSYIMPSERSPDIDTRLDMEFAKFLLERNSKKKQ